jgi:hypothetical protein
MQVAPLQTPLEAVQAVDAVAFRVQGGAGKGGSGGGGAVADDPSNELVARQLMRNVGTSSGLMA